MSHIDSFMVDGINCQIHVFGPKDFAGRMPLFVLPVGGDAEELIGKVGERLKSAPPFALVVFLVSDWYGALSPWPAPALKEGDDAFAGGGRDTLNFIISRLIPEAESRESRIIGGARGLLGYSMAGLFALWALFETGAFRVCASCSGALWYEGFSEFVAERVPVAACSAYICLGTREEKARNPNFARVGEAARGIEASLLAAPNVEDAALVWYPGGHFHMIDERLTAALMWMAERA